MNKKAFYPILLMAAVSLSVFSCLSCSNDNDTPNIESVWHNMASEPAAQLDYAYPGQTLCLRGSGFSGLRSIVVNGTKIDVQNTLIYDTDNSITFKLPTDVITSYGTQSYIKVITTNGEATYSPFFVKNISEKPTISKFSTTTLTAGCSVTITGTNLDGTTEVLLPLAFDQHISCKPEAEGIGFDTEVTITIPDGVSFAKGQVIIVMQKTNSVTGTAYEERVYSNVTNFTN